MKAAVIDLLVLLLRSAGHGAGCGYHHHWQELQAVVYATGPGSSGDCSRDVGYS